MLSVAQRYFADVDLGTQQVKDGICEVCVEMPNPNPNPNLTLTLTPTLTLTLTLTLRRDVGGQLDGLRPARPVLRSLHPI